MCLARSGKSGTELFIETSGYCYPDWKGSRKKIGLGRCLNYISGRGLARPTNKLQEVVSCLSGWSQVPGSDAWNSSLEFHGTISIVQRCVAILMNFALAVLFLQAPFLHVHEHESTEHHPHAFLHTHFPHHHRLSTSKTPELRGVDPDDDAVFEQWFSATISELSTPDFIPTFVYIVAPTWSSEPILEPNILSGHDPPRRSRSAPRSPPI